MTEASASVPKSSADLTGQSWAAVDRIMAGWSSTTGSAAPPVGAPPMPTPAVSAQQLESFLEDLAARRGQVQALRAQLEVFDDQLGMLEATVRPVLEWTRAWASIESALRHVWRPPAGGST